MEHSPEKNIEKLIAANELGQAFASFGEFVQRCNDMRAEMIQTQSRYAYVESQVQAHTVGNEAGIERNRIALSFLTQLESFRREVLSVYFDIRDKETYLSSFTSRDAVIEQILDLRLRPRRYTLERQLAEGNSSIIYQLLNPDTRRHAIAIVLKLPVLPDEAKAEVRRLADLRHRNIIKILDYDLESYPCFIISEYIYGPTLIEAVDKTGPRPPAQATDWLYQLTDAIDYLRQKRILHTNIRPSKIYVDDEWQLMISPVDMHKVTTGEHTFNRFMDVCRYGSPELLARDGKGLNMPEMKHADQYALGLLGYKMLTGDHLFEGDTVPEVLRSRNRFAGDPAYRKARMQAIPEVTFAGIDGKKRSLADVIRRLLRENPADRYESLHELLRHLHPLTRAESPDISLARRSYRRCMALNKEFIRDFYQAFQQAAPHVRDHFSYISQKRQSAMLQMAVDVLLDLSHKSHLLSALMGNTHHTRYQSADFELFLDILIKVLAENDPQWDEATAAEWAHIRQETLAHISTQPGQA
ncbi:MAG: protein kinase [Bacteroidia bacterium]|nr:protein kinase [Bacteroidia bacterium]